MPSSVAVITSKNVSDLCFLPTGKSKPIGFEDDKKSYAQVYCANSIQMQDSKTLKKSREWIEQHVDRRVQLFFQQMILCYQTPFHFEAEKKEDQVGKGSREKKTQAAHSSTLPCLYAYCKDAKGRIDDSSRFVFLKYSHAYWQHNGTVELSTKVNQLDSLIDWQSKHPFRSQALKIVNTVAQGEIDPVQGTKKFLKKLEKKLVGTISTLSEDDERRWVAHVYLEHVREIKGLLRGSSEVFDAIMGVRLPQEEVLRTIVYKRRFQLIQKAAFIESQIAKRIVKAQKRIFGKSVETLTKVDDALRYILLKEREKRSRVCLEKLFCTSLKQLKSSWKELDELKKRVEELEKLKHAFKGKVRKIEDHEEIPLLQRDLRKLFRELTREELLYRAQLFKGLRGEFKGWYQREFVEQFKDLFPHEPMSQAMVSRLEQPARLTQRVVYKSPENQRKKDLTVEKAKKIAQTFDVDVGIFLPALFTSDS